MAKATLKRIFGKERGIIIGALHFPPLLGYPAFPGMGKALEYALRDARAFERGGVDGIIFENNYDQPHTVEAGEWTVASMVYLGGILARSVKVPLGANTLWNDFKVSLSLAKIFKLSFVRVPVFVDTVKADCGVIRGNARAVVAYRKSLRANKVALFTDIHVKHSKLLSHFSIVESARRAIKGGSDALILTGKWTGDAPDIRELARVRVAVGDFPILLGSGVDHQNVRELFRYANGAIVSTSLKQGGRKRGEANVKAYTQRIDEKKVRCLTTCVQA